MSRLDHELERQIVIRAQRSTVFRFFTDSELFARWWGDGSAIDPRPEGALHIRYPNGVEVGGEVVEIVPDERIVFTYGYLSGQPIPEGASRATITFQDVEEGTRVALRHALPDAASRDAHVAGWRYQLAVLANIAAAEQHAGLGPLADAFLAVWSETDAGARGRELAKIATGDVAFHDAFGCVTGRDELEAHIGAVQMHMPGARLERRGEARQCQGFALVDWEMASAGGAPPARGTNLFELAPDGRIRRAVGFR